MYDLEAAEDVDHIAVDDRHGLAGVRGEEMQEVPAGALAHHLLEADAHARKILGMDQDLGATCRELSHTADVVWMPVGADDPIELADITPDPVQVANQGRPGAGQAGVDERQAFFHDQVAGAAAQLHRVDARDNLHAGSVRLATSAPLRRQMASPAGLGAALTTIPISGRDGLESECGSA